MENRDLIFFSCLPGVGRKTLYKISKDRCIVFDGLNDYVEYLKLKGLEKYSTNENIIKAFNSARQVILDVANTNGKILTILDVDYPEEFYKIDDPPVVLYIKGDVDLLRHKKYCAVIGTRHPSDSGYNETFLTSKKIASEGVVIVAGLALGCDTAGHKGALSCGGKTIAFLPSGYEKIYPLSNKDLALEIIKTGLLVSEYPPYENIKKFHFIDRDRLQSGLSRVIIVGETPLSDGTMHTVSFGEKYKKSIFALNLNAAGNKMLLENNRAALVDICEILSYYKNSK